MAPILTIKAGRAYRRSDTSNWVDPSPTKGLITLEWQDDLLSFGWRSREGGSEDSDDEYILFPGDCNFQKVESDPSGHTYVLKFSSSDQRLFFWFQDANEDKHELDCFNINSIIDDPEFVPVPFEAEEAEPIPQPASTTGISALPPSTPAVHSSSSQPPAAPHPQRFTDRLAPAPESLTEATPSRPSVGVSQDQVDAFARLLQGAIGGGSVERTQEEPAHLTDILTPSNLLPLLSSSPSLIQSLVPHLPSSIPLSSPPSTSELTSIISSPQFTEAVEGFEAALRTGGLEGLMRGLGLPEGAGRGVGEFLDAVEKRAREEEEGGGGGEGDDRMDTD